MPRGGFGGFGADAGEEPLTPSVHLAEVREAPHVPQPHSVRHARQDELHRAVPRRSAVRLHRAAGVAVCDR